MENEDYIKVKMKLPLLKPKRYYTGEYRFPKVGELYLLNGQTFECKNHNSKIPVIIIKEEK